MLFEYYSTSFICVIQIKLGKYFVKYDGIRLDNLFIVNYSYLCYRFIDIRDHAFVRLLYLRVLILFIQYIYKTSYMYIYIQNIKTHSLINSESLTQRMFVIERDSVD